MNTNNYPSATPAPQGIPPRRNPKNLIVVLLAIGILGSWGYFLWLKNKDDQKMTELVTQFEAANSANKELQMGFDASLSRLDSLAGYNNKIEGKLVETNSEISQLQSQIKSILRKQNITEAEKRKAEELIGALNEKIRNLKQELVRLIKENETLNTEMEAAILERDLYKAQKDTLELTTKELADKVTFASTLNAYAITITPVQKKGGSKEKVTSKAKKADKLVLAFDVANRIAETGSTDIYILIIGPDGKPVSVESTFTSREEGEKPFTAKISVEIETGKKKHVEFALNKNENFKKGNYHFTIYHNGIKIGESLRKLA